MPIRVQCPTCRSTGKVPDAAMNRAVLCPACRTKYRLGPEFVIPETPAPSAIADDLASPGVGGDRPRPLPRSRWADPGAEAGPARVAPRAEKATAGGPRRKKKPKAEGGGFAGLSLGESRSVVKLVFAVAFVGLAATAVYRSIQDVNRGAEPVDPIAEMGGRGDDDPVVSTSMRNEDGALVVETHRRSGKVDVERSAAPVSQKPAGSGQGPAGSSIAEGVPGSGTLEERFPGPREGEAAHQRTGLGADVGRGLDPSMAWVGGKLGGGTGFLVRQGLVATTTRAIAFDFLQDVQVWFPAADGEARGPFPVALVAYDRDRDAALLAVLGRGKSLPPPFKGSAGPPPSPGTPGKLLHVKGVAEAHPVDSRLVSFGPSPKGRARVAASLDSALRTSEAGGPLVDSEGRAIGMATLAQGPGRPATFILLEGPSNLDDSHKRAGDADFFLAQSAHRMIACIRRLMMAGAVYSSSLNVGIKSWRAGDKKVVVGDAEYTLADYREHVRRIDLELFSDLEAEFSRIRGYPPWMLNAADRTKFALAADLLHRMRRAHDEPIDDPGMIDFKAAKLRGEASVALRELSFGWDVDPPDFLWPALENRKAIDPAEFRRGLEHWIR